MQSKTTSATIVVLILILMLVCIPISYQLSHGYIVTIIEQLSMVLVIGIGVLWIRAWSSRNKERFLTNQKKYTVLIFAIIISFVLFSLSISLYIAPAIIKYSLRTYGTSAEAHVISYRLIRVNGKYTSYTDSVDEAKDISATISFNGHIEKISVTRHKNDRSFDELYQATQDMSIDIPIYYIDQAPGILMLQSDS